MTVLDLTGICFRASIQTWKGNIQHPCVVFAHKDGSVGVVNFSSIKRSGDHEDAKLAGGSHEFLTVDSFVFCSGSRVVSVEKCKAFIDNNEASAVPFRNGQVEKVRNILRNNNFTPDYVRDFIVAHFP